MSQISSHHPISPRITYHRVIITGLVFFSSFIPLFTAPIYATPIGTFSGRGSLVPTNYSQAAIALLFNNTISLLLGLMTTLAGLYFMIQLVTAGYSWLAAGGDAGQMKAARDKIIQSVIGLTIVVAAYAIVGLFGSLIGLNVFNPLGFLT